VDWLNRNVSPDNDCAHAGGMTKCEPGEKRRILVPAELAA
jgi:hypothetical protein